MAAFIVIGVIAWALMEQGKHLWRAARGEESTPTEHGFRGYLNDRWAALADRHHRNRADLDKAGAPDWLTRKRLQSRRKALALAGFKTDEDIERAAVEHRRRLDLIRQGTDPDVDEPAPVKRRNRPDRDAHGKYKPTIPETNDTEEQTEGLDTIDVIGLTDLDQTDPEPKETAEPTTDTTPDTGTEPTEPQAKPWTPFTDPKENTMTAGEINNPHDVKLFAAVMSASLDATTSTVDTLTGISTELADRVGDYTANATTAETAAAGMDRLGMSDAAAAARALIEQQQQIQAAMQTIVDAIATGAAAIADAVEAARPQVDALVRAYQAQLAVADARAGAGRGNLAADSYLDGDA